MKAKGPNKAVHESFKAIKENTIGKLNKRRPLLYNSKMSGKTIT